MGADCAVYVINGFPLTAQLQCGSVIVKILVNGKALKAEEKAEVNPETAAKAKPKAAAKAKPQAEPHAQLQTEPLK